jgi:hypothetical protein
MGSGKRSNPCTYLLIGVIGIHLLSRHADYHQASVLMSRTYTALLVVSVVLAAVEKAVPLRVPFRPHKLLARVCMGARDRDTYDDGVESGLERVALRHAEALTKRAGRQRLLALQQHRPC